MPGVGPIDQLVELLARLPGIGRRTARRLVYFLLAADRDLGVALGEAIASLRDRVHPCSVCGNITEADPCSICSDSARCRHQLCVVTSVPDLLALESAGAFKGIYHVLGGLLAPLDGVGPEELRIDALLRRVGEHAFEEVILATPPSVEGEATATYVGDLLRPRALRISRIASGVPAGGELELLDALTLSRALEGRRDMRS